MAFDLIPRSFWTEDEWLSTSTPGGVTVSEDDKHVYVSAALPGLEEKDIDITFDKGVLWIKGDSEEEEKQGRKYYRKATSSFSYQIAVPGDLDLDAEPEAVYKNGIMTVTFIKSPKSQPKKISIKASK